MDEGIYSSLRFPLLQQIVEVAVLADSDQGPVVFGEEHDVSVAEEVGIEVGSGGDGDSKGATVLAEPQITDSLLFFLDLCSQK